MRYVHDAAGPAAAIHPIEHQAGCVTIEIRRRAEASDERHRTAIGTPSSKPRLLEQKACDDPDLASFFAH